MTLKKHIALLVTELARLTDRGILWSPGSDPNLHFTRSMDGSTIYLEISGERIVLSIGGQRISGTEYNLDRLLKAIEEQYEYNKVPYQKASLAVKKGSDAEKLTAFSKIAEQTVAAFRRTYK